MVTTYLGIIVLTHLGFLCVYLLLYRYRPSSFLRSFSLAWSLEIIRALFLLGSARGQALPTVVHLVPDLLYTGVVALVLCGVAEFAGVRLPRYAVRLYLISAGVLLTAGRLLAWLGEAGAEPSAVDLAWLGALVSSAVRFFPGAVVFLLCSLWIFRLWKATRLSGLLVTGASFLPKSVGNAIVPVYYFLDWFPTWGYLFWFLQVLFISVGVLIAALEERERDRLRVLRDLRERVKELATLRSLELLLQENLPVEETLKTLLPVLEEGWQFPEITAVRIGLDRRQFTTSNFRETPWRQRAEFALGDGTKGFVEVVYLEERPEEAEGPFLAEERTLINTVADRLKEDFNRRLAEKNLRESEQRWVKAEELALVMTTHQDLEGRWTKVPASFCRLLRCDEEELLGRPAVEIIHPEDAGVFVAQCGKLVRGEVHSFDQELRLQCCDDRTVWVYLNCSIVTDSEGRPVGFLTYLRDISSQRSLEEQLLHAQKLEAVGRLAGGIAHDFNNLLTAIMGYTSLLLPKFEEKDPRVEGVAEIEQAARRAAGLTRQLLAFSRRQLLQFEVVDVNQVVLGLRGLLERVIGEDVRLENRLMSSPGWVRVDTSQIEQVLLNLAVNSRDAMPNGGVLTISTSQVEREEDRGRSTFVQLTVEDTGEGIPEEMQPYLFEPFFTTKEPGKGTGLGLATTYGIVSQSGGRIEFDSKPGRGTRFRILLPVAEPPAAKTSPSTAESREKIRTTILVVEDEPAVRSLICRVLERDGYEIVEAGSTEEALSLLRSDRVELHLLITDLVLPGGSGHELAQKLTSRDSNLRVLFISGYTNDEALRRGEFVSEAEFLQKPFSPELLKQTVRRILND